MSSALLLERLRRALAPDLSVEMELASGGMGSVFLGHDHSLDRAVAVKLLRPELASAAMAERFLKEARILAGLHHPNVVQVYRVGEVDGLFFYVMEYLSGETLDSRLQRGPLPLHVAYKVGRDLLDGLEAAHRSGIVHRDVKPSNVMLVGRRAMLTDFGIAIAPRRTSNPEEMAPGIGTPGFMSPEQMAGAPVTPRSDIYSAGATLYEVFSGRRWADQLGNWRGIPRGVARVLKRALALDPEARWPDAGTFRRALWRLRSRHYLYRTLSLIAAGLVVGAVGAQLYPRLGIRLSHGRSPLQVVVRPFEFSGPGGAGTGDSLAQMIRDGLTGSPDFSVAPGTTAPAEAPLFTISGRVVSDGDAFRIRAVAAYGVEPSIPLGSELAFAGTALTTAADSIVALARQEVWQTQNPIAASLPQRARPRTAAGLKAFFDGERLVAAGRWEEARNAFAEAKRIDATCYICDWRIGDVQRWMGMERDTAGLRRAMEHIDSFPPSYQSLMRAAVIPSPARIDTLVAATKNDVNFFLPFLELGNELFHRGPLVGHARFESIEPLEKSVLLRHDYIPTWEQLAWVRTAEGDSAGAQVALNSLGRIAEMQDRFSKDFVALLSVGYAWRFYPPATAETATWNALADSATRLSPALGAGPRMLPSFDAPEGAVAMGQMLQGFTRVDLRRSGAIAMLLGSVARGRLDDAAAAAERFREWTQDEGGELFLAELGAALRLIEPGVEFEAGAVRRLRDLAAPGAGDPRLRVRAAWMYTLLRARDATVGPALEPERLPRPFGEILLADSLARAGERRQALLLTDTLARDVDLGRNDPFVRSLLHLFRAEWQVREENLAAARRELRWHENTDLIGYLTGEPQVAEVDWAFGTIARWRRIQVLTRMGLRGPELCHAYRGVEHHWRGAAPLFAARADSAGARATALGCPPR